jgi:phage repressor protein C with HTH and peptisase S24 domain
MKLTHTQFWRGIDRLAKKHDLSAAGLAIKAGLDSTCFNLSKRTNQDTGKPRWPSTESIAKVLHATKEDLPAFFKLMGR